MANGTDRESPLPCSFQTTIPRVTQWLRMPARFAAWQKYRYGGPSPDDVREGFEQFSQMLFGLVAPYYATEAELDDLLEVDSPTAEHARRLRDLQLRPAQRRYFFERFEGIPSGSHTYRARAFSPTRLAGKYTKTARGARAGGRRATTSLRSPPRPLRMSRESYWPSHQLTITPMSGTRSPEQLHSCRWMWRST